MVIKRNHMEPFLASVLNRRSVISYTHKIESFCNFYSKRQYLKDAQNCISYVKRK